MFKVDLYNQVPYYGKEQPEWGGPAVCQMAMKGYPPGATSCYIDQTTIWNYIQANNQEGGSGPWGIGWYSDPYAVTKVLNDLCPPTGHWFDVSNVSRDKVLYTLLRWMATYNYAAPICLSGHDVWVLLIDYQTSDDPRVVATPTLERIGYNDPRGWYENAPGDIFLTWSAEWGDPCDGQTCGQKWDGKYVGIGEPPTAAGSVLVKKITRVGKNLMKPKEAALAASEHLQAGRRERTGLLLNNLTGVRAQEPMLVRELPSNRLKKESEGPIKYYVVPFRQKSEVSELGTPLTRLCVRVNAFTGNFEGLTMFARPVRYIQQKEAGQIAARNLGLKSRDLRAVEAELVFQPLQTHVTSSLPIWQFTKENQSVFVAQNGSVFGTLNYRTYRGG
jgi:hypothetical protein